LCYGLLTCHWVLHDRISFLSFEEALRTVIEKVFPHIKCLPTIQKPTAVNTNKNAAVLYNIFYTHSAIRIGATETKVGTNI